MDSKIFSNNQVISYGDTIYSKTFTAFNGVSNSVCAKIVISVDPDGVLRPSANNFAGAVPAKIQIFTSNDDGRFSKAIEFDKSGRVITNELWSVTKSPSGNPLVLMANTNDLGQGPTLSLRRSRGTWNQPAAVIKDDNIFRICWYAHDGQSYKEVSSIHSKIEENVSLGTIPTSLAFKIFDQDSGVPTDAVKINSDHSTSFHSISSLNNKILPLKSPLGLLEVADEIERDKIENPKPGTMIFVVSLDTVQVYTKTHGWKSLF